MKYSTPGVSRQRSHKSNSTYIINSELHHWIIVQTRVIIQSKMKPAWIKELFSQSHTNEDSWAPIPSSLFMTICSDGKQFWILYLWRCIITCCILPHFKLILAIWSQEDDLITLSQWWSVCPHVKGSNWFCFNIFFPDLCHLLTLNLLYTGWNIYEFWLQNIFTTASIWINQGKRRFVRSLVCCGSRHRSISPPTSNSSYP